MSIRLAGRVLRGLIAAAAVLALVIGLPWALWHFIGWPLPDHLPSWHETQAVLLSPMTGTFLLDVLACLCWTAWFFFTLDVLRCTVAMARGGIDTVRPSNVAIAGPMHALAGVLIGAVVLSVLGNRPTPALTAWPTSPLQTDNDVVATAQSWTATRSGHNAPVSTVNATASTAPPQSVVVRAPANGVYDTLSRIAQRSLGTAERWPEIYALNKGSPQPYGHTFTNPNLIFPGQELLLPADATTPAPPQPPHDPSPPDTRPAPTTGAPPTFRAVDLIRFGLEWRLVNAGKA